MLSPEICRTELIQIVFNAPSLNLPQNSPVTHDTICVRNYFRCNLPLLEDFCNVFLCMKTLLKTTGVDSAGAHSPSLSGGTNSLNSNSLTTHL